MSKIRVGIVGSAGYTGGELIRLLLFHPQVDIVFAYSESNAGNKIYNVHQDLIGDTEQIFSGSMEPDIDVLFLCLGHGHSKEFLNKNELSSDTKIIDLAQDYRLSAHADFSDGKFVYGLPELNRKAITTAKYVANPGCFATNITLALLPLASKGLLTDEIHINATTGSTGAGQKPTATTHFSWRSNNLSVYKTFEHQHLQEISESLTSLQSGYIRPEGLSLLETAAKKIHFIPQRGDFSRGIFSTTYLQSDLSIEEAYDLYETFYAEHPFTHVSRNEIYLKQVVNTNKAILSLEKHDDKLVIVTAIDNLVKGASGQAVQNMNLMFGLEETAGLQLKSIAF